MIKPEILEPISSIILGIPQMILAIVFLQDFRSDGRKISILLIFLSIENFINAFRLPTINNLIIYHSLSFGMNFLIFSYIVGLVIMDSKTIIKRSNLRKTKY